MDPVLAAQLARDLDRTLAALAHGERLPAGCAVPDRSPGDGDAPDPSPGLPPTIEPR
jgi:hypothetical protein